ncbi:MAG: flagellar biosynthesis protein FlhF [Planctomycetota bacterium]|nr:flagellar biosynthesis protein FlhF [Planctomycetota bacterium]
MATTAEKSPLKTYHGTTMADALAKVKQDLGPDAVILHTRTFRDGGMLGLGSREVVEITASSDAGVMRPARVRPRGEGRRDPGRQTPHAEQPTREVTPPPPPAPVEGTFVATPPWFSRVKDGGQLPTSYGTPARTPDGRPAQARSAVAPTRIEPKPGPRTAANPSPALLAAEGSPRRAPGGTETAAGSLSGTSATPSEQPPRQPLPAAGRLKATRVEPAPVSPDAGFALDEELAAIRRLVGQVLQSSRRVEARSGSGDTPSNSAGPIFDLSLKLLDSHVATEIADEVTAAVRDELSTSELADAPTVRDTMLRHVAKRVGVVADPKPPGKRADGRPSVIALIGPTGVGKTTTVAKLAATCKLRYGKRIGLITADTYRIAAVEQLRTYAEIVGMPLKVVLAPQDVPGAIDALSDCDTIILDTAGRSQRDAARLDELGEFLKAAEPDQTQLVLSLAAAESVIAAAAERYGALGPDRLLLTKLDEAVDYGVILNIAHKIGLPISFVTTGQEVPDHIEPASAERLARLVLDGGSAWQTFAGGR